MTLFVAKSTHGTKNQTLPILIIKETFAKNRRSKGLSIEYINHHQGIYQKLINYTYTDLLISCHLWIS